MVKHVHAKSTATQPKKLTVHFKPLSKYAKLMEQGVCCAPNLSMSSPATLKPSMSSLLTSSDIPLLSWQQLKECVSLFKSSPNLHDVTKKTTQWLRVVKKQQREEHEAGPEKHEDMEERPDMRYSTMPTGQPNAMLGIPLELAKYVCPPSSGRTSHPTSSPSKSDIEAAYTSPVHNH